MIASSAGQATRFLASSPAWFEVPSYPISQQGKGAAGLDLPRKTDPLLVSANAAPAPSDQAGDLAAIFAALAEAAKEPAKLKALAESLGPGDDFPQVSENRIGIKGDACAVSNPKGHDAMKIYGPYPHGDRWRVLTRQGTKQRVLSFTTEQEALEELVRLRKQAARQAGITTEKAIEAYLAQIGQEGLRESSRRTAGFRLKGLLETVLQEPLATITPRRAMELYQALPGAVDTRLNILALAKKFGRAAVENGWTDVALWADIKPKGRRKCGKPKLGLDESRKYLSACLAGAASTNKESRRSAVASAMPLLFGLRSSEVLGLKARDLDDGGRLLRITAAKTRAGIRTLVVPEWFRPLLLSMVENLPHDERIFPREKTWLHHHVVNTCRAAGVSRVTPHGLRGTHADLSLVAAATPLQVSQALGHTNTGVTFRHYADKDLAAHQQHQQAIQALAPTLN